MTSVKSSFRPLIASSLALALGVSVASATTPNIQYGTNGAATSSSSLTGGLTWNGSNGGGTNSFWTLRTTSGSGDPVDIVLQFNNNGNGTGSLSDGVYTVSQNGAIGPSDTNSPVLKFSSTTNGIDMQGKTLTFDFLASNESSNTNWNGTDATHTRKMFLDLSGVTQENGKSISLKGNLEVKAGKPIGADIPLYRHTNFFEATFGGDVIGDINILHSDVIDPNGKPYYTDVLKYNDLSSTFTFKNGANLQGSITSEAGENTFIFEGGNIMGNIEAKKHINTDDNAGNNTINRIVFTRGAVTLGTNSDKKNILIDMVFDASNASSQMGSNTLIFHSDVSSANINLAEMKVRADRGVASMPIKNTSFNVLSLNNTSASNTISIDSMDSNYGYNIIGKNLAIYTSTSTSKTVTYDSELFETNSSFQNATQMKTNFTTNFVKNDFMVKGKYTVGTDNKTSAITTLEGGNFINVEEVEIKGNITNNAGSNIVKAQNIVLGGESNRISISTSGGGTTTNTITANEINAYISTLHVGGHNNPQHTNTITANSGSISIDLIETDRGSQYDHINTITLDQGTLTVGAITSVSRGINTISSAAHTNSFGSISSSGGTNTITFSGAGSTNTITGSISLSGGTNTITINGSNSANTITGDIISSGGRNTITISSATSTSIAGKIIATGSGNNSIQANNGTATFTGISTSGYSGSDSGNTIDLGSGSITINARENDSNTDINGKAVYAKNGNNKNQITASIITINGDVYANGGVWNAKSLNSFTGSAITVAGNIIGNSDNQNNFTLTADNATLTLKGANSAITTLTAFATTNTTNTLNLDATSNDSVNATINTLTNGGNLKVNFAGINDTKSTQLALNTNTTSNRNLKSVSVASGLNNTLKLNGNNTMAIADAVSIGETTGTVSKAITFDLNTGSSLTFTSGLTTNAKGIVAFNLGGTSNTITGALANSGENNFNFVNNANLAIANTLTTNTNAITNFNLIGINTLSGTLTNNGTHNYNVDATSATLRYGSGLAFSSGTNNINFQTGTSTLNWKNSDGSAFADISTTTAGTTTNINLVDGSIATIGSTSKISTSNGTTNINFVGDSSLTVDQISTASGITDIRVANGANGILNGVIAKTGGNSVITFLQAQAQGNTPTSTLTLNGATNALSSVVAQSTYGLLASGDGVSNNIDTLTLNASGKLAFYNGTSTITTINASNGTLELTTKSDAVNTVVNASGISGGLNVLFSGTTNDNYHYSTLSLTGANNQIASVTSNAKNAVIELNGASEATDVTIGQQITIGNGNALIFALEGGNNVTATASDGIVVQSGGIFGVSVGNGSGTKTISVSGGDIDFQTNSTLLIDFQADAEGSVSLGSSNGKIVIGENRNSIINFRGGGKATVNGGIQIAGGNNTVNFLGNGATLEDIEFTNGHNTINVASDGSGTGITGTVITSDVEKVTNEINLDDNATLSLRQNKTSGQAGDGSLISSGLGNILNFKGDNTKLEGSFGAEGSGSATINVGSADKTQVNGTITGTVSNATLKFNAGKSTLTLQSANNTFKSIDSQANDGVLILDTATKNGEVNATISGATTIASNKSLSFDFVGNHNSTITTTGGLVIDGTLGVIINGNGEKKVTGNINLNGKGTLLVDYSGGTKGASSLTLGDGNGITIRKGESSIINFNGGGGELKNSLTLDGGNNTINFNVDASLDKITLTSGNNTFNVADNITATIENTTDVGGVNNTINLASGSTIDLQSGNSQSGSGSIITSLSNTLNFNGNGATLKGSFGASENGKASVNVGGSNSIITGSLSNASISFTSDNADLTLQSGNSTITSLSAYSAPSVYTRNGRTIQRTITNTLTLDDAGNTNAISATIQSAVVGNSVGLKFGNGSEAKTFKFASGGNHLSDVSFGTTSTNNTLAFATGSSTLDNITLANDSDLTIELENANLDLTNGYTKGSGTSAKLKVIGNAGISGGTIGVDELSFGNSTSSKSLSVSNTGTNTFASVDSSNTGTLIANDSDLSITALTGDKLTAGFSGNGASRITIQSNSDSSHSTEITLANVVLSGNTSNNTLDLSSLTSTTIAGAINVGANQALAIDLGGASSTLTLNGLSGDGDSTINANATASNTIAGTSIVLNNLNLNGTGSNTTNLTANSININTLNANATTSNKLVLDATNNTNGVSASINMIGTTTRGAGSLDIALNSGSNATTLALNGNAINSLDIQGNNNTLVGNARITTLSKSASGGLTLDGGRVNVGEQIAPVASNPLTLTLKNSATLIAEKGLDSTNANIDLTLNNSTLSIGAASKITSLAGNGGVIDFVSSGADISKALTVTGDNNANANVITYVSGDKANVVTVEGTNSSGVLTISVNGDADEIFASNGKIQVAQIGTSGNDKAVGGTSNIDGEIIQVTLTDNTQGGYFIGKAVSKGVDTPIQEVVSSALAVNYDLYLANFNSLNKRMGELRDNPYNQGVWARVFGGNMGNDFGVGSKTDYVTAQAGYDYSLSLDNARNYMGIAVAYGASHTKSNPSSNPNLGVLDDVNSSMVEVGIYNSYVADSGWYNDTIFKFDYIMSDFTLKTGAVTKDNSTNNFAMILSDEFGYRYKFAESEKGNWYIDPQVEVAFGYFNQSDFNQALNASATREMQATQDAILTLRTRAGLSLGKKFNTEKGFASLYVGAFYEYDYIEGGNAEATLLSSQSQVSNPLASLSSNGRAIVNVGSNIGLTKDARLYIDVEKSFGDKQRTFMQFNVGARYSF